MPPPTDITLAGTGYMVAPGTYRRVSDGVAEGRARRIVQRDFFGGQHRAFQFERDRGWDGLSVHGVLGGQGIEPWPVVTPFADTGIAPRASLVAGSPCHHVVSGVGAGGRAFVWINGRLFRCPAGTTETWSGLTLAADFGTADGYGLAPYIPANGEERIAVALGAASDIRLVDPDAVPAQAVSTFRAGERATCIGWYGGVLVYGSGRAGEPHVLRISDGTDVDTRALDAPIVAIGQHQGRLAIATRSALWLLGGRWQPARPAVTDPATGAVVSPRVPAFWQGDAEPFFSAGFWTSDHDFPFLVSFGGRLYTFLGHELVVYDPATGSERQGWRAVGLSGQAAFGACVAGGLLIVALQTWAGRSEIWAGDGVAWWRITVRDAGPDATACWPLPTAGAGNTDLLVFRDLSATYDLVRLIGRGPDLSALAPDGEYVSSLLDGGERDQPKLWRLAGAVFAAPQTTELAQFAAPVTLRLDASLDAGATWIPIATTAVLDGRPLPLNGPIPVGTPAATFVQLRVLWGGVLGAAPVLAGLWVEYEPLDVPLRRRRWSMTLLARDGLVQRSGAQLSRSGEATSAALWTAWRAGQALTFRDIDEEDGGGTRVRITGLDERVARPDEAANDFDSLVTISLVEV